MKKKLSLWRVLGIVLLVAVVLGGVAWQQGWLGSSSGNSIMVIAPYQYSGTWVFDDPSRGLKKEAFVSGIPELIDRLVADIPDAENGFRLLFSAEPFPGYQDKFIWQRSDAIGNWYLSETYQKEGWLCPSLFKYFKEAPPTIYVKAEAK